MGYTNRSAHLSAKHAPNVLAGSIQGSMDFTAITPLKSPRCKATTYSLKQLPFHGDTYRHMINELLRSFVQLSFLGLHRFYLIVAIAHWASCRSTCNT